MEEEQFALFKTQVFFCPINKNESNYQIVTEQQILLPPLALTINKTTYI